MNENNIYPFYENPEDIAANAPAEQKGGKQAEAELYKLLKEQLPDNWFVLYDIPFTGGVHENQIDFLVIVPGKGIINLECKGGGYEVQSGGRRFWHPSNKLPYNGDLIEKARKVAENFHHTFNGQRFTDDVTINLGAYEKAVIFPLHNFSHDGEQQTDQKNCYFDFCNEPVYTAKDVHGEDNPLKSIIEQCLNKSSNFWQYYKSGSAEKLFEHFRLCGKANDELCELNLQNANRKIEDYTIAAGNQVIEYMIWGSQEPYVHLSGTAGTGKTWVAKSTARRFAEEHPQSHVLYVCYNKTLAADVSLQLMDLKNIDVGHFHRLGRICYDNNRLIAAPQKIFDEQQTDENFLAHMDAGNEPKYKYDLILVDEAQDFNQTKFDFIVGLTSGRKKVVFFSDTNQNIRHQDGTMTYPRFRGRDILPIAPLVFNLRNTANIHSFSQKLIENDITKSGNCEGPQVEINTNADINKITTELIDVCNKYDLSRIAVLADRADFCKRLTDAMTSGNKKIKFVSCSESTSFEIIQKNLKSWRRSPNTDTIWVSTIHAFKGLEADVVLLVLSNGNTPTALKYVGITRAKYLLKIFEI